MKKILSLVIISAFALPVFAITDTQNNALSKQELKYQLKIEKLRQKQELEALKHPERAVSPIKQTNMTLGTAQRNIKIGTSQDEVALALGSPNIATVDSDGHETWIYDKVASVATYNSSGFSLGVGGFGGGAGSHGGGGGLINAGYGRSSGGCQTNQKTLTIVIKFTNQKVSSFNYHMSSF